MPGTLRLLRWPHPPPLPFSAAAIPAACPAAGPGGGGLNCGTGNSDGNEPGGGPGEPFEIELDRGRPRVTGAGATAATALASDSSIRTSGAAETALRVSVGTHGRKGGCQQCVIDRVLGVA